MDIDATLVSLAESLREERNRAGITLEQLAGLSGLSIAHLSRLESGERQPSVAALVSISRALAVPVSALFGEHRADPAISIYPGDQVSHTANGLTVAAISGFPGSATIEALRVTIPPSRAPSAPARHRGEESIYVLTGNLRLEVDDQSYELAPGDAVHFNASHPHRLHAVGVATEVLVVAADVPEPLRNFPIFTASINSH